MQLVAVLALLSVGVSALVEVAPRGSQIKICGSKLPFCCRHGRNRSSQCSQLRIMPEGYRRFKELCQQKSPTCCKTAPSIEGPLYAIVGGILGTNFGGSDCSLVSPDED
ncbi:hypothetical protein HRG_010797 [Hirsutella rhossiliensis]|uniref:Hydrophobin n=1 Tax=Hirsutella rhossiliensis TaxID=111463 RepID=A0A9P8MNA2_9HYPO|nr:uncharacterized protein HRG_10797 [Hirsutella rhossiliensis]KAH0958102.1 hypothetical protein HRG_10797 [Hirsutella rhossiliensis]